MLRYPGRRIGIPAAFLFCTLSVVFYTANAQERPWTIEHFQHTAWTSKDGAPQGITSLAQTKDGYLWIGSERGLTRFDGVAFESFTPKTGETLLSPVIFALCADSAGGLWIDYDAAGVSYLKNGHLTHYDNRSGLPAHHLRLICNPTGSVWILHRDGIWKFADGRWVAALDSFGLPDKPVTGFVDQKQTLWVTTKDRLFILRPNDKQFVDTGIKIRKLIVKMADGADHDTLLMQENGPVVRLFWKNGKLTEDPNRMTLYSAASSIDRHGGLWFSSLGGGIYRLADAASMPNVEKTTFDEKAQHYGRKDGLSGDYVWPTITDQSGSVWFGTSRGLDRFRESTFASAPIPENLHDFALAPASDGGVWIASSNAAVMHLTGESLRATKVPADTLAIWRDSNKDEVLAAGRPGLWRLEPGAPRQLSQLSGPLAPLLEQRVVRDVAWRIWLSLGHGILAMQDSSSKEWRTVFDAKVAALAMEVDSSGSIMVGLSNGRLMSFAGPVVKSYGEENGIHVGSIKVLTEHDGVLWVGGEKGVSSGRDGKFRNISTESPSPIRDVTGLVFANDGSMWIHAGTGIIRVPREELETAKHDIDHPLAYRLFDETDGIPGPAAQLIPLPSAIKATDGMLWFATEDGIIWVDPAHLSQPSSPLPVSVDSLTSNDMTWRNLHAISLPPGTHSLTIAYSVPSLAAPERVKFRYRLDGIDGHWQDGGSKREVRYTNLGPGWYTFHVAAGNGDGTWSDDSVSTKFRILPGPFETWWFHTLCAMLAAGMIGSFFLWRLRGHSSKVRLKLETKYQERDRIARELHDTILQGMAGLVIHIESIATSLPEGDRSRGLLERLTVSAREAMIDGRQRILELRSDSGVAFELSDAIERLGKDLSEMNASEFAFKLTGMPYRLKEEVREELFDIAREALLNAFNHAVANLIEVDVVYGNRGMVIAIRDDGCGFDSKLLVKGQRPNHWGLLSMRERARNIGAVIDVLHREPRGSVVTVTISARRARKSSKARWLGLYMARAKREI